jgi:mannose-6-phosphate isomerase-like protein (cupin superfamily)
VHLFEAVIYVQEGHGCTEFWRTGETRRVVEWQRGSLFALPISVWHQFRNLSDQRVRFVAVTNAPTLLNLFQHTEFVFGERFAFTDRYVSEDNFFSPDPRAASLPYGEVLYENNFIADLKLVKVEHPPEGTARGEGYARRYLRLAGNRMLTFAAEYPVGTYTTAHWHGGGVTIYIANGRGFTLMWPPEAGMRPWQEGHADLVHRIDFHEGSMYAPPTGWWHQHFNTGKEPARYVPTGPTRPTPSMADGRALVYTSVRQGGHQIDYDLEDPHIRGLYEEALRGD